MNNLLTLFSQSFRGTPEEIEDSSRQLIELSQHFDFFISLFDLLKTTSDTDIQCSILLKIKNNLSNFLTQKNHIVFLNSFSNFQEHIFPGLCTLNFSIKPLFKLSKYINHLYSNVFITDFDNYLVFLKNITDSLIKNNFDLTNEKIITMLLFIYSFSSQISNKRFQTQEQLIHVLKTIAFVMDNLFNKKCVPLIVNLIYKIMLKIINFLKPANEFSLLHKLCNYSFMNPEITKQSLKFLNHIIELNDSYSFSDLELNNILDQINHILIHHYNYSNSILHQTIILFVKMLHFSYIQEAILNSIPNFVSSVLLPLFEITSPEIAIENLNEYISLFHSIDDGSQYSKREIGRNLIQILSKLFPQFALYLYQFCVFIIQSQSDTQIYQGLEIISTLISCLQELPNSFLKEDDLKEFFSCLFPFLEHPNPFIRAAAFEACYMIENDYPNEILRISISHILDSFPLVQYFAAICFLSISIRKESTGDLENFKEQLLLIGIPNLHQIILVICQILNQSKDIRVFMFLDIFLDIFSEHIVPFIEPLLTVILSLFIDCLEFESDINNLNCLSHIIFELIEKNPIQPYFEFIMSSLFEISILKHDYPEIKTVFLLDFMSSIIKILPENTPIELYRYFIYDPSQFSTYKEVHHYINVIFAILETKSINFIPFDELHPIFQFLFQIAQEKYDESSISFCNFLFQSYSGTDKLNSFVEPSLCFINHMIEQNDNELAAELISSLIIYNPTICQSFLDPSAIFEILFEQRDKPFFPQIVLSSYDYIPHFFRLSFLIAFTEYIQDLEYDETLDISLEFLTLLRHVQDQEPELFKEYDEKTFPFYGEVLPRLCM